MTYEVNVVEYNPEWPKQFKLDRARIIEVLGDQALAVEHIGSTSVAGLPAKPILDIAVAVKDLRAADSFVEPLQSIGYEYVPKEEFPKRRFFRKGEWRKGTHHLHVYELASEEWENQLGFRNYLRNHPDALRQYAELKKKLAHLYPDDRITYTNEKAPFIQSIIALAKAEGLS
ncbi:GrpB family protein [Gorillibacterium sp. CAU 1737]|uniref:GrpB family protein n=1 Tax=Gorillibacterium sp. CAU 1737 TaxID=3140362 RepID=UPI00326149E6